MRAAHRIFSGILQFFRANWAQNLRDLDAGRLLFSNLNAMLTRSALNDIVQYAQRPMAEGSARNFLCAGRAEFPEILQIFRPIFSQFLRDLDAGLALYLAFERTPTWKGDATKF